MSDSDIAIPLTYYGRYLFGHSPTYNRWARLTAKDIHTALHHRVGFEGQGIWFYLNHPIRWTRIVGVVVAYDDLENRHALTIDDGSGHQIELISWKTPQPGAKTQKFTPADLTGVELHSIVKAKGSVNEFWGRRQILLKRITVIKDTNDEVAAWAETIKFKKDVLCKPWVVSDETVAEEKRKLTVNAEDEERRRERKRRKLEKEMRAQRKDEERKIKVMGKENMLWDSLVEKPHDEEQTKVKRKVREDSEALSPKRKKPSPPAEPTTSGIGYRGRRRPPLPPPPPPPPPPPAPSLSQPLMPPLPLEPPQELEGIPPITTNSFKGRRRITPAPTFNPTPLRLFTPELIPEAPPDPLHQPSPPPESISHSHHRALQAEKLHHDPQTETDASDIPTSNLNAEKPSTYRGRRRASKPPAEALNPQALTPSLLQPLEPSKPPVGTSSYRGRRRASKLLAETSTANVPLSTTIPHEPSAGMSYRERWRIMKAQKEVEAWAAMPSLLPINNLTYPSEVYDTTYLERQKAPRAQEKAATQPIVPTVPETIEPEPMKKSIYRGKRRGEKPPADTLEPEPSYLPASAPSAGSQPPEAESSSYRGRRRTEKALTYSFELPATISTFVPTPVPEETSSYCGRQRTERALTRSFDIPATISTFVPTPSPEETSSYRSRQRSEKALTHSFDLPTTISTFVPTQSPEETSSYRGRRRSEKLSSQPSQSSYHPAPIPPSPVLLPPSGNPSQISEFYSSSCRGRRRG